MAEQKVCPKCNNRRHVFEPGKGWVRCDCLKEIRANGIMAKSGFPETLWEIDSSSFKTEGKVDRKELSSAIKKMVKSYDKKNVFIYSNTPDRDRASAIISRYTAILNPSVETIYFAKLETIVQNRFKKENSDPGFTDPVSADITVLSIGDEITNRAHQNALYTIIYDRLLGEKFTIISSLVPQDRLLQIYHKAVADIIQNNFKFYSC